MILHRISLGEYMSRVKKLSFKSNFADIVFILVGMSKPWFAVTTWFDASVKKEQNIFPDGMEWFG